MMRVTATHNGGAHGTPCGKPVALAARAPGNPAKAPASAGFLFGICALLCLVSPASAQNREMPAGLAATPANFDHLLPPDRATGLKLNRSEDAWRGAGTLTVGNDWSNFQDFLGVPGNGSGQSPLQSPLFDDSRSAERITWSGGGFSIALEEPADEAEAANEDLESLRDLSAGSPNLILSWQGEFADQGRYQMSAVGRKLDLKGVYDGMEVDQEELGWGLQVAGGWHFRDLFAALRVTLGKGIDSLILKRFGSDVSVSPAGDAEPVGSVSILPSLTYSINERSDLHFSLGRYESRDGGAVTGVDTLDTINLGYTWSPWPSTRIGVEVAGKDFDGDLDEEDSTEITIGAQTRF